MPFNHEVIMHREAESKDNVDCPDEATLRRHLLGEIQGDLAERIDVHFENCPHCLANAQRLDDIDEFVEQTGAAAILNLEIGQVERSLMKRGRSMKLHHEVDRSSSLESQIDVDGYRIQCMLGRGGMGVVYKAKDENLKRTVALKILARGITPNDEDRHRFRAKQKQWPGCTIPTSSKSTISASPTGIPFCRLNLSTDRRSRNSLPSD